MKIFLVFVILFLSACTTLHSVNMDLPRDKIIAQLEIGDQISVQTKAGYKFQLIVKEITATELVGEQKSVAFVEIAEIKKEKVSVFKTSALATAATLVTIILVGIISFASMF